uniref:Uncharacterized protein n=1 Tax=Arundo donax TaxID=35708 RepID=A0A0A9AAZ2_ARUDO
MPLYSALRCMANLARCNSSNEPLKRQNIDDNKWQLNHLS